MSSLIKKRSFFLFLSAFALVSALVSVITTCKSPADDQINANSGDLEDSPDGDTRLVVAMHDAPFKMEGRDVQELNLTVLQIVIIDSNDKHITILDEERQMELLSISRSDPVVLSNVPVEPGTYKELRLVLKDNSTIKVDGEVHPIKIPSGSQSGLKLKGPFEIPKGKLFRLVIDFVASEFVHWNKGQGWMLKPVLRISSAAEIIGIFRGSLTLSGNIGYGETLVQLYSDNTARLRIARYPNYTVWAGYNYNSVTRILQLDNINLDAPGLGKRKLKAVMKKLPDSISLPIKQWSLDSIIAIDTQGMTANLYRVEEFNFSRGVSFTEFTLHIDYTGTVGSDWYVLTEVVFLDSGMPVETVISPMQGSRTTQQVLVPNDSIQGTSTRIHITSFLFRNYDDINIEWGTYASIQTPMMVSGSRIYESTANSWQPSSSVFRLYRDTGGEFTVAFPKSMNIKMDHKNFTSNKPIVNWEPYPGATGYLVVAIIENKNRKPENEFYKLAYNYYTTGTSATVDSELISFTPAGSQPTRIDKGDFIVIEVYALDGSGFLDTANRTGALFRDTLTVVR